MENAKRMRELLELKEESSQDRSNWLRVGDLQTFAAKGDKDEEEDDEADDDEGDDDEEEEEEDSSPSLEKMLKEDPELKKQFGTLFKKQFADRLKGLDLKEARKAIKLLADQEAAKDKKAGDDDEKDEKLSAKMSKFENRAKRTAVKEYAIDNNLSPKLLARLVDLNSLELDDDGEVDPDELAEAVEELTEEFPELFRKQKQKDDEDDDDDSKGGKTKARSHGGISKKKSNTPKAKDLREAGANKALERAKAKGLIKE